MASWDTGHCTGMDADRAAAATSLDSSCHPSRSHQAKQATAHHRCPTSYRSVLSIQELLQSFLLPTASSCILCKQHTPLLYPHSRVPSGSCLLLPHTAEDCLMLWKLTRVGEVGMDMARATRARMECLSCHRCHRFRTAERTWG